MTITKKTRLLPPPFIGTRFTIELTDELDFVFWKTTLAESGDAATIDWGDGCVESFNDSTEPRHSYQNAGRYVISVSDDIAAIQYSSVLPDTRKVALIGLQSNARKLTAIKTSAFTQCANLTALDIGSAAIETLNYGAFTDCVSLPPRINLQNVRDLPTRASTFAFTGCTSIREIHFSAANEETIKALDSWELSGGKFGAENAMVYFDL